MAAIAAEAGVALKTVYVAFETKAGVLRALWNLLLRGDTGDAPVGGAGVVPRDARGARPGAPATPERAQLADREAAARRRARGDSRPRPRPTRTSRRSGSGSRPSSATTSERSSRALDRKGARPRARRRRGRPTSSGHSTIRTSGNSSSAGSAGRRSSTSSGAPTPPARSSCAQMEKPRRAGLLGSRPVSRILSRVTIPLCSYPGPRRAASAGPVRLAPDGVWLAAASPRRWWALTPPFHPYRRPTREPPAAVSFLFHFPSAFAAWPCASVLPYGVRTFLETPPKRRPAVTRPAARILARQRAPARRRAGCRTRGRRPRLRVHHELAADEALERRARSSATSSWSSVRCSEATVIRAP